MSELFAEEQMNGHHSRYPAERELGKEDTPFQALRLLETQQYGKMLMLDGIVQTTERDEFIYHEMMTHVPMFTHTGPRSVLIIGGGDGGILREVLRHETVTDAVMVEIDERVVEFSRKYLPTISDGAFDDERTDLVIADGAEYVRNSGRTFDVVIVDSPDPIGPAEVLFSQEFYRDVKSVMNPDGILVRQTGSTFLQPDEQKHAWQVLSNVFATNAMYVYAVPTYVGGFFSTVLSTDRNKPVEPDEQALSKRFAALQGTTQYYNPGVHVGAFNLPEYVKGNLK
ncbi:MAG: polyamine aminopropyltransferase [Phycisphaerae bacterium]